VSLPLSTAAILVAAARAALVVERGDEDRAGDAMPAGRGTSAWSSPLETAEPNFTLRTRIVLVHEVRGPS